MDKIEKIRQEIEKELSAHDKVDHLEAFEVGKAWSRGHKAALENLKSFIDSLPDENNPEQYNPVYDEDYLNEKIAKATKSWEGVDVDKMLADCRGYEEKPSDDLEEAAERFANTQNKNFLNPEIVKNIFKTGAKWMAGQGITVTGNTDDEYIRILEDIEEAICKIAPDSTVNVQIRK